MRTAAGAHIYCGLAQEEACSSFEVVVSPGPTTASTCEAEGDASPAMDSLVEGVAGMTGYFNIQVTYMFSLLALGLSRRISAQYSVYAGNRSVPDSVCCVLNAQQIFSSTCFG